LHRRRQWDGPLPFLVVCVVSPSLCGAVVWRLPFLLCIVASRGTTGRAPPLPATSMAKLGTCAAPSRGDGRTPPASVDRAHDEENVSPRGRGWEADPGAKLGLN
jgi:hypothetical protein